MDRFNPKERRNPGKPPDGFDPRLESLSLSPKLQQLRDWLEELSWRT